MNTDDRRVRKTKKALIDALVSLLSEKELRSITIKELTDTADIHRATFYVHYQDVYDLYEQLENHVLEELRQIVSNDASHSYEGVYKALIDYILENSTLCKMFFGHTANSSFQKRANEVLEESYLRIWLFEDNKSEITEYMRYLTAYNVQGCNAIIRKWMQDDFSCPREQIAAMLRIVNDNFDRIT